jgi:transcriptional regulator with XRE-family HTH domain
MSSYGSEQNPFNETGAFAGLNLRETLVLLRKRAKLNRRKFAELLDVSDRAIMEWEDILLHPRYRAMPLPLSYLKILTKFYVEQGIFEEGLELDEAKSLWKKAEAEFAFDESWFRFLLENNPVRNQKKSLLVLLRHCRNLNLLVRHCRNLNRVLTAIN